MQRVNAQPTFTDLTIADLGGPKATAFFDRCLLEIPFDRLAESVGDVFTADNPVGGGTSVGGAPHWPVVMMVKVVFLQKCFGLSDPVAEEMLKDRISFRRFVGLSFDDKTPDHSTISLFRKRLRDKGHGPALIQEVLARLGAVGLIDDVEYARAFLNERWGRRSAG